MFSSSLMPFFEDVRRERGKGSEAGSRIEEKAKEEEGTKGKCVGDGSDGDDGSDGCGVGWRYGDAQTWLHQKEGMLRVCFRFPPNS